jgi:hypothetical protein
MASNSGHRVRPDLGDCSLLGEPKMARQLAGDLVVVSEVQAVVLTADRLVDVRCR